MTDPKYISCTSCKFIKQTDACCICGHPEQTNQRLTEYVYWTDRCDLWEHLTPDEIEERAKQRELETIKQFVIENKELVKSWMNGEDKSGLIY